MNADPEVMRYFPAVADRAASDASIGRMEALFDRQGFGLWALELAETGEFLGFTGLNPMPYGVPGAGGMEVGGGWPAVPGTAGMPPRPQPQRSGWPSTGPAWHELWSMTAVLNTPSQAVMRRIGMTWYADFEHPRIDRGHRLRPHVVFRLQRPRAGEAGSGSGNGGGASP